MIKIKRIYEKPEKDDGYRVLVDRLWPRGVAKEKARFYLWLKDVAPSTELRKWFAHDPEKWAEFQKKYKAELRRNKAALDQLKKIAKKEKKLTLLYAAKDEERNEAIVLKKILSR